MVNSKVGEQMVQAFLKGRGWNINDVSSNPDYWYQDIDLIISKGKDVRSIEIKTDGRMIDTNNFFIELNTDLLRHKQGWALYSKADYIFYFDSKSRKIYVFNMGDMREYLDYYPSEYEIKTARDNRKSKISVGATVNPQRYAQHYNLAVYDI